jgi:hypothetical protein
MHLSPHILGTNPPPWKRSSPWDTPCQKRYNIDESTTNIQTVLYVLCILVLTVLLEVAVHADLKGWFETSKPATTTTPYNTTNNNNNNNKDAISIIN